MLDGFVLPDDDLADLGEDLFAAFLDAPGEGDVGLGLGGGGGHGIG